MSGIWFGRVLVPGEGALNGGVSFLNQESIPGEISWQSGGGESPPSTCLLHSFCCSPGSLGCECSLLAQVELFIHETPKPLSQSEFISTLPTWMQCLAFGPVELHKILMGLLLKYVQVPLDDISFFYCVNYAAQLRLTCRLGRDVQFWKK